MAPEAESVMELPIQTDGEAGEMFTVGIGFTSREIVLVLVHVNASTPVTEYIVVADGVTTILFDTVPPGFQVYDNAPFAVRVDVLPAQTAVGEATVVIVGPLLTGARTVA